MWIASIHTLARVKKNSIEKSVRDQQVTTHLGLEQLANVVVVTDVLAGILGSGDADVLSGGTEVLCFVLLFCLAIDLFFFFAMILLLLEQERNNCNCTEKIGKIENQAALL